MNFGQALEQLKLGVKVTRKGYNRCGIFIELQRPDEFSKMTAPYLFIDMTGLQANNEHVMKTRLPWVASQTDLLAENWEVI